MTLDEAIRHCEEVAERYDRVEDSHADDGLKQECIQCAADHRQLDEWLTELKEAKRLLRLAVEDLNEVISTRHDNSQWRYADEAEKLLKEE